MKMPVRIIWLAASNSKELILKWKTITWLSIQFNFSLKEKTQPETWNLSHLFKRESKQERKNERALDSIWKLKVERNDGERAKEIEKHMRIVKFLRIREYLCVCVSVCIVVTALKVYHK